MKKITFALLVLLSSISLFSVPAKPGIIKVYQPDGTTLDILIKGGSHYNYKTTSDGYLITENSDGYYVYAQYNNAKQLVATTTRAKDINLRSASEIALTETIGKYIASPGIISERRQAALAQRVSALTEEDRVQYVSNSVGDKGLAILVGFSDLPFTYTRENFNDLLNKEGYSDNGATGSASDYFKATSNGQFNPKFDVYGPYTLDKTMEYYGKNVQGHDTRADQMIVDAVAKLKADGSMSTNLADYDTDGDGYVDNIFVFYAGYNEAQGGSSNTIWPHKWAIYKQNVTGITSYDGVTIKVYSCSSELTGNTGNNMCGIGTFCHEFSHVLGLPDFYNTDYSSDHKTCDSWDIMDNGCYNNEGRTPPVYSAHEKFFVGWLTPTIINEADYLSLEHIETSNTAYMITSTGTHNLNPTNPSPSEYYLLENRQLKGWDKYLPGSGLMISKTKYNKNTWNSNIPNNNADNMGYDIIEADGIAGSATSKAGDLFPGTSGTTFYSPYENYPITQIEERDGYILFSFMGGTRAAQSVTFNSREYGIADYESQTEGNSGEGITLPNVDVTDKENCHFIGWSYSEDAKTVNAGKAGDTYYPFKETTLYAVYVINGKVVDNDGEDVNCWVETFDGLSAYATLTSNKINEYTDNNGWSGSGIACYKGSIKVSKSGYLTTPEMLFYGGVDVKLTCRASSAATLTVSVEGTSIEQTINITKTETDYNISIFDFPLQGKLKIKTSVNSLFLNNLEFCYTGKTVDVDNVTDNADATLSTNNGYTTVENIPSNATTINCYDVTGRMIFTTKATNSSMNFKTPQGFYIIQIVTENENITLKGI